MRKNIKDEGEIDGFPPRVDERHHHAPFQSSLQVRRASAQQLYNYGNSAICWLDGRSFHLDSHAKKYAGTSSESSKSRSDKFYGTAPAEAVTLRARESIKLAYLSTMNRRGEGANQRCEEHKANPSAPLVVKSDMDEEEYEEGKRSNISDYVEEDY